MESNVFYSKREEGGFDWNSSLIEKGRQLHDQAIMEGFILLAGRAKHLFRKCFGGSSRNQEMAYFPGEITAKKQIS